MPILDTIQCKLCEKFICDEMEFSYGSLSPKYHQFVYRWDLLEYVCQQCDKTLGPDPKRIQAMQLCSDKSILKSYLDRFSREI